MQFVAASRRRIRAAIGRPDSAWPGRAAHLLRFSAATEDSSASGGSRRRIPVMACVRSRTCSTGCRSWSPGRLLRTCSCLYLTRRCRFSGAERGLVMLAMPEGGLEFVAPSRAGDVIPPRRLAGRFLTPCSGPARPASSETCWKTSGSRGDAPARYSPCRARVALNIVRTVESGEPSAEDFPDRRAVPGQSCQGQAPVAGDTVEPGGAGRPRRRPRSRARDGMLEKAAWTRNCASPRRFRRRFCRRHTLASYFEASAASIPCRIHWRRLRPPRTRARPSALRSATSLKRRRRRCRARRRGHVRLRVTHGVREHSGRDAGQHPTRRCAISRSNSASSRLWRPHSRRQLSYCNAGHNPPFVVGVGRAVASRRRGHSHFAHYDEETVVLEAGDTIVVFSDGVSE